MLIGSIIRTEREKRGWSQLYLADLIGVTQGYIGHLERGYKIPNAGMIVRLADAFNISIDRLFGRDKK